MFGEYSGVFLALTCCLLGIGLVLGTLRFLHKQPRTHVMTIERPEEGEEGKEIEEDEDE